MVSYQSLEEIKKTIKEFFQKTSFDVSLELLELKEQTVYIKLKTDEPKILIGQNGQTLAEIQHLLKAILRRKIISPFYIDVDINDYKEKKTEYLKETARSLADEVAITGKEKTLAPMSASERRIIHLELQNRGNIKTESIGQEPERRLVIKPV